MKKLVLSQIDLNIEEVNLSEIKGGQIDVIYSGIGRDGVNGGYAFEFTVILEDDSYYHLFVPYV